MRNLFLFGLLLLSFSISGFGQSFSCYGGTTPNAFTFNGTIGFTSTPTGSGNCEVVWNIGYNLQLNGTWWSASAGMECGGTQQNFVHSAYPALQSGTWNQTYQNVLCSNTCNLKIQFHGPDGLFASNCASVALSAALPVELVRFQANKTNKGEVVLDWATATERNNAGFEVERSKNAGEWETIGFVAGAGNSDDEHQYAFTDNDPMAGINYYRLRQVDQSGDDRHSNIAFVENRVERPFSAYPNPVSSSLHFVGLNEPTDILIMDILGNAVMQVNTIDDLEIPVDQLASGHYVAMIVSEHTQSQVRFQKL